MSRVAEKVLKVGRRCSIVLEFAFSPFHWVIWPALVYFPPHAPDRLGGAPNCHDWTFAWLRFGITFRVDEN